ncbi:MAG: hypothetical protein U0167_11275 [bacterium]
MVFNRPTVRGLTAAAGLIALLLLSPGCIFSPESGNNHKDPTAVPKANSVQGAIDLYAWVWTNKDYDRYQQLLHDEFEYFPQSEDLSQFPWLVGSSWGKTEELQMARNMFNPDFQPPPPPSGPAAGSIDTIKMTVTVTNQVNDPQRGGVVVSTHAVAQVMYDSSNGASSDVRFEFLVVPDPHNGGLYQVREQRELPLH